MLYFGVAENVLERCNHSQKGLPFIRKVSVDNELEFLDITTRVSEGHVCWWSNPHVHKQLLPSLWNLLYKNRVFTRSTIAAVAMKKMLLKKV